VQGTSRLVCAAGRGPTPSGRHLRFACEGSLPRSGNFGDYPIANFERSGVFGIEQTAPVKTATIVIIIIIPVGGSIMKIFLIGLLIAIFPSAFAVVWLWWRSSGEVRSEPRWTSHRR
jgi:hypothetical protein